MGQEYSTATWLKFDARDRDYVVSLKCSICIHFEEKLHGSRNFNPAFIIGSKNLKASSFKEHAATDMHKRAMLLLRKSQPRSVTDYAPIAKALSTLGSEAEEKLIKKFEIAYLICKEGMAFLKIIKHVVLFPCYIAHLSSCSKMHNLSVLTICMGVWSKHIMVGHFVWTISYSYHKPCTHMFECCDMIHRCISTIGGSDDVRADGRRHIIPH